MSGNRHSSPQYLQCFHCDLRTSASSSAATMISTGHSLQHVPETMHVSSTPFSTFPMMSNFGTVLHNLLSGLTHIYLKLFAYLAISSRIVRTLLSSYYCVYTAMNGSSNFQHFRLHFLIKVEKKAQELLHNSLISRFAVALSKLATALCSTEIGVALRSNIRG